MIAMAAYTSKCDHGRDTKIAKFIRETIRYTFTASCMSEILSWRGSLVTQAQRKIDN